MNEIPEKDRIYITLKERNFTQIDDAMIRDRNLSLRAKGLMAVMLSYANFNKETGKTDLVRPISCAMLAESTKESRTAISRLMLELIEQGYVYRYQSRKSGTFSTTHYIVYETREMRRDAEDRARLRLGIHSV